MSVALKVLNIIYHCIFFPGKYEGGHSVLWYKTGWKPRRKWCLSAIVRRRNFNWVKGVQLCGGFPGYPLSPTVLHDLPLSNPHPPTDVLWFPDSLPLSSPLPSLDAVCLSHHPYWGFAGLIHCSEDSDPCVSWSWSSFTLTSAFVPHPFIAWGHAVFPVLTLWVPFPVVGCSFVTSGFWSFLL